MHQLHFNLLWIKSSLKQPPLRHIRTLLSSGSAHGQGDLEPVQPRVSAAVKRAYEDNATIKDVSAAVHVLSDRISFLDKLLASPDRHVSNRLRLNRDVLDNRKGHLLLRKRFLEFRNILELGGSANKKLWEHVLRYCGENGGPKRKTLCEYETPSSQNYDDKPKHSRSASKYAKSRQWYSQELIDSHHEGNSVTVIELYREVCRRNELPNKMLIDLVLYHAIHPSMKKFWQSQSDCEGLNGFLLQIYDKLVQTDSLQENQCTLMIRGFADNGFMDNAYALLNDMPERNIEPHARTYAPLISALCQEAITSEGDYVPLVRAVDVLKQMCYELYNDVYEESALNILQACRDVRGSTDVDAIVVNTILQMYRDHGLLVPPAVLEKLLSWFNSDRGSQHAWIGKETHICIAGYCQCCNAQLEQNKVSQQACDRIAAEVAIVADSEFVFRSDKGAAQRSAHGKTEETIDNALELRSRALRKFALWSKTTKNNSIDIVIDGMNVGYLVGKVEGLPISMDPYKGRFSIEKLLSVIDYYEAQGKSVVAFARSHTVNDRRMKQYGDVQKRIKSGQIYVLGNRITDDLLVLFAAARYGPSTKLVSCDLWRDYYNALCETKIGHGQTFLKWLRSAQIMYTFRIGPGQKSAGFRRKRRQSALESPTSPSRSLASSSRKGAIPIRDIKVSYVETNVPSTYDRCSQAAPGSWHILGTDGRWICATNPHFDPDRAC